MLIRSQNKRYLIDMNGIEIYKVGKEIRVSRWVDHYNSIGEYSTEAKAIKVLDMIQNKYTEYAQINGMQGEIVSISELPKCFIMPQDSEVEV